MTRELLDDDGENQAVRVFLMMYGGKFGVSVSDMQQHMKAAGFPYWPTWTEKEQASAHLTKAGAQDWLRYLFSLEATHNVELTGAERASPAKRPR